VKSSVIDRVVSEHTHTPLLGPMAGALSQLSIEELESELRCQFSAEYREFLEQCRSGMVGSLPIWGSVPIDLYAAEGTVLDVTLRFRSQSWPLSDEGPVISTDQGGNPIVELPSGIIMCHDHDFGGRFEVATNFLAFLESLMD
jgi:hypothetical protein